MVQLEGTRQLSIPIRRPGRLQRFGQFGGGAGHVAEDPALFFGHVERLLEIRTEPLEALDLLLVRQLWCLNEFVFHRLVHLRGA
jgi:hypothetical protein